MKTLAVLAVVLGVSTAVVRAQSESASQPSTPAPPATHSTQQEASAVKESPEVSLERAERLIYFQTNMLRRVFGLNVGYSGILPDIKRADRPLQLLNPWAPARYGDAWDNVVLDPVNRRAEGFVIFAIHF